MILGYVDFSIRHARVSFLGIGELLLGFAVYIHFILEVQQYPTGLQ